MGAVELQRVDAVGVPGEGVKALLSGRVPNLCMFEERKEAIRIILQGKGKGVNIGQMAYSEVNTTKRKPLQCGKSQ